MQKALLVIASLVLVGNPRHISGQTGWQTRITDHFEIYYERQLTSQVDRVATEAERAYGRISADLQYDLPERVPLLLLSELPDSEASRSNTIRSSGAPPRDHLLLRVGPADQREGTLTHELTHLFEFEIIARSPWLPAWVYEGLAEYERLRWTARTAPAALVTSASTVVPAIDRLTASDRNWGRMVFAFIADEFGTQGIRRYLMVLKRVDAGGDAIQQAFGLSSNKFDRAFERYVKAR